MKMGREVETVAGSWGKRSFTVMSNHQQLEVQNLSGPSHDPD